MSKIFRLYNGGASSQTYQDWQQNPTSPYNTAGNKAIEDPDGANASHQITSIPSPFARIDLCKNAFAQVISIKDSKGEVDFDGKTIFHKIVSDVFDVGEIFFNFSKFKDDGMKILRWNPADSIARLEASPSIGHGYLAKALEKYLSGEKPYDFDSTDDIYLLQYDKGPDVMNIIGATSPATVFFTTANDLSWVSDMIHNGQDKPFDQQYQPLFKRDHEYIKAWWYLKKGIDDFHNKFPELDNYLLESFKKFTPDFQKELRDMPAGSTPQNMVPLAVNGNTVKVHGLDILEKVIDVKLPSDFEIRPSEGRSFDVVPLVLPVEKGNKYTDLKYTTALWDGSETVPYKCMDGNGHEIAPKNRKLPGDLTKRPYLTVSDFLEDRLIRVPHKLNKDSFFNGGYTGNTKVNKEEVSYLLPLTKRFFEYFTIQDLMATDTWHKDLDLTMERRAEETVMVKLKVPIKGNAKTHFIEYTRFYTIGADTSNISINNNGGIDDFDFESFVMPIVRVQDEKQAFYRIGCVGPRQNHFEFTFYNTEGDAVQAVSECRNTGSEAYKADVYSVDGHNFDFIQVHEKGTEKRGILVPVFKSCNGTKVFHFAIDLGTSNTHIEYTVGDSEPKPFDYDKGDVQASLSFIPTVDKDEIDNKTRIIGLERELSLIMKDVLPQKMGNGTEFGFPTRTVLSRAISYDEGMEYHPFGMFNIPFTYDKRSDLTYNTLFSNIKWEGNEILRRQYIDCLLIMLRNKVLLNDGDLSATKLTWFYPLSMPQFQIDSFRQIWDEEVKKYFCIRVNPSDHSTDISNNVSMMSESAAPIIYYFKTYGRTTDTVSIDIGGGTTDIAFANKENVLGVTSFRFAANNLFCDPYASNNKNGIIDYFKDDIGKALADLSVDLSAVFRSDSNKNPANMASFLFSLSENSMLKEVNKEVLDLNAILQKDTRFKVAFLIFYGAIIYHVAQIVQLKGYPLPSHIAFSGNGSKLINFISLNDNTLSGFTKAIFENVIGRPYPYPLGILGRKAYVSPKEATCKGGLKGEDKSNPEILILKADGKSVVDGTIKIEEVENDEAYKASVISSVKRFFSVILEEVPAKFPYYDYFGIKEGFICIAKEVCMDDNALNIYLDRGLDQMKKSGNQGKIQSGKVSETLFFLPVKGVLNELTERLQS